MISWFLERNRFSPRPLQEKTMAPCGIIWGALFLWDFNNVAAVKAVVPDPAAPNARKVKFEELAGAVVRASFEWDPAANGVELGTIIEFKTKGEYAGQAITISLGAYEWDQPDGRTNAFANNIKTITKNALTYLKDN